MNLDNVKAIFLDYTGTMIREDDEYSKALLKIFVTSSDLKKPQDALATVWGLVKKCDSEYYMDTLVKKDEMVDRILDYCVKNYNLTADLNECHDIWRKAWVYAPAFDDVKAFFDKYADKIYIVTNDDYCYVEESCKLKGLKPAGIISADQVRACKPHVEILQEAVRVAGVEPGEAVLIGDSMTSDVECAKAVGVTPIYLDRKGRAQVEGLWIANSLLDLI